MRIGGIQRTSTLDFPGVLSCVVFTRGCDLDCFYCHNRSLLGQGDCISQEEVLHFLRRRQGLLDGVVVSGGEPALQPDLKEFLIQVRSLGYRTKLDTNGQHPQVLGTLIGEKLLDYVAVDIKALPRDYKKVCGAGSFQKILECLQLLETHGVPYEVRTTLYPGFTLEMLRQLLSMLPQMPCWRLNIVRRPQQLRASDEPWFEQESLTARLLIRAQPQLRELQPNLIIPE